MQWPADKTTFFIENRREIKGDFRGFVKGNCKESEAGRGKVIKDLFGFIWPPRPYFGRPLGPKAP